jgi:hypothetical protein
MPLVLTTEIPHGNACDVAVSRRGSVIEAEFAADPHGGPECLWFCFRLAWAGAPSQRRGKVSLVLKHSGNMLGGDLPAHMRPVICREGGDWERLDAPEVEKLPDGRSRVMWLLDAPATFTDIAFCYPYGQAELDALLSETGGYWRSDVIGVSQAGRPLIRLSNAYGIPGGDRPGLYLVARQHSGETPGSWVLDGFLRHVASLGSDAPLVWAVPFTNPDGVEGGDYGKDNFPYDLNRAWGSPPMRHETLVMQRDLGRWRTRCRPVLGIDFHAPGGCEDTGVYVYPPNPKRQRREYARTLEWLAPIQEALTPTYAAGEFVRIADYASRWETPGFTGFCTALGICAFTVETAYALSGELVLTREHYREIGQRIAQAVVGQL